MYYCTMYSHLYKLCIVSRLTLELSEIKAHFSTGYDWLFVLFDNLRSLGAIVCVDSVPVVLYARFGWCSPVFTGVRRCLPVFTGV